MSAVIRQTASGNGGGYVNSYTLSFGSNVTAGSLLVASLTAGVAETINSFVDNNSNTWTLIDNGVNTGQRQTWLYYVKKANAGATTITVTFGASQFADSALIIREYGGLDNVTPLDKNANGNDGGSFVQSHSSNPTAATTFANELVIVAGGTANNSAYTAGTGYGNLATQNGSDLYTSGMLEDKSVSSTGAQTGQFTTTGFDTGQVVVATFRLALTVGPVTDTTTVSDTPTVFIPTLTLSVSDSSAMGESTAFTGTGQRFVTDSSAVSDSPTIVIPTLVPSVSDSSAISDTPTLTRISGDPTMSLADSTAATDSTSISIIAAPIIPVFNSFTHLEDDDTFITSMAIPFTVPSSLSNAVLMVMTNQPRYSAPSSANWNGTSMTPVGDLVSAQYFTGAFYLANPTAGTFNINLSWDTAGNNVGALVVLLTGAGVPEAAASYPGFTGNSNQVVTANINVLHANAILLEFMMSDVLSHVLSEGAGQTELVNVSTIPANNASSGWRFSGSYKPNAQLGTQSMSATLDAGGRNGGTYQMSVISIPGPLPPTFSVSESITVSDTPTILKRTLSFSVEDDTAISDFISAGVPGYINPPSAVVKKTLLAKVSTQSGAYIGVLRQIEMRGFSAQLNGGVGECVITANVPFDYDHADIIEGNDVEAWISDKETVVAPVDGLYARLVYKGYISLIERDTDGTQENITIHLLGYYTLLAMDVLRSGGQTTLYSNTSGLTTTIGFQTSADIGLMARTVIESFRANTSLNVHYNGTTDIPDTGTLATYTFQQKTYREALDQLKNMAPANVYWYVDPTGKITFKPGPTTPTHTFIFGRHFTRVHVEKSLEKVRNVVLIWDGKIGGTYKHYEDAASIQAFGRRTERINDYGIGASGTADNHGAKFLAENKDPGLKVVFTVFDSNNIGGLGYDIENIQPGDTCALIGFSSQLSDIFRENMLITSIVYTLDTVEVTAEIVRSSLVDFQSRQSQVIVDIGTGGLSIPATYT